jgi:hypothetical protein
LRRATLTEARNEIHIVIQFDASRTVQLDLFQSLPDHIVRLSLAVLRGFDGSRLINITLVVDVELSKGV